MAPFLVPFRLGTGRFGGRVLSVVPGPDLAASAKSVSRTTATRPMGVAAVCLRSDFLVRRSSDNASLPFLLPDSNVLRGRIFDPTVDGPWRTLLDESVRSKWTVVLSEVVEWELAALLRRHLKQQMTQAAAAARVFRRFVDVPGADLNVGAIVAREMERLRGDVLGAGGELRELPEMSLAPLVHRAIDHRRPFGESGSGFRDAIIWETAIELAGDGEVVVLISGDRRAYSEAGALHPDLASEVRRRCAAGATVELAADLPSALERIKTGVVAPMTASPSEEEVAEAMIQVCRQLDEYTLYTADLARFGWPRGFAGVRIREVEWTTGPVWEVVLGEGKPVYRGVMGVTASIDARGEIGLMYDTEIQRLVEDGELRDCGRGLADGLDQFVVDRPLVVIFEMELAPGPMCRVVEVRLPERPPLRSQMRLDAA